MLEQKRVIRENSELFWSWGFIQYVVLLIIVHGDRIEKIKQKLLQRKTKKNKDCCLIDNSKINVKPTRTKKRFGEISGKRRDDSRAKMKEKEKTKK